MLQTATLQHSRTKILTHWQYPKQKSRNQIYKDIRKWQNKTSIATRASQTPNHGLNGVDALQKMITNTQNHFRVDMLITKRHQQHNFSFTTAQIGDSDFLKKTKRREKPKNYTPPRKNETSAPKHNMQRCLANLHHRSQRHISRNDNVMQT